MTADASSEVRFTVRPMRAEDEAFVSGGFIRWYRESDHTRGIRNTEFFRIFKEQWAAVLEHFTVLVAHAEGDENELAGFIAFRGHTVAAIYVKKDPWRKCGAARLLLAEAGFDKSRDVWLLYGEPRAMETARSKGWRVNLVPATQAIRLLLGVA